MQKLTTFLWFDTNGKDAVDYYMSVFPDGKIVNTEYYPGSKEEGLADFQMHMAGKELVIAFEILGQRFAALNGGPQFTFSEAVSFAVDCKDQNEIDYYWEKLSAVPEAEQCGWCKDRFGVSWQVVPENVMELTRKPGGFANMMKMKKLIIAEF
jgi:predicted 3-demethylubiquinone-9 3-methyltransferase (glyoxalase superfamily)